MTESRGSLRQIVCPLCGPCGARVLAGETRIIGATPPTAVVRCSRCGLLSRDPLPSPRELEDLYSGDTLPRAYEEAVGQAYELGDRKPAPHAAARLVDLERLLGGPGRLLDVGAARGVFLGLARSRGWQVEGTELSADAVRSARREFSLDLVRSPVKSAGFGAARFDAVHLNHALEHLPEPIRSLQEIHRLLRPRGILAIEVPNEFGDLMGIVRERLLGRPRKAYAVPSPHLYFFTPSTLRAVVRRAGFQVHSLRTPRRARYPGSFIPFGSWAKRALYLLEGWFKRGPLIELYAVKP